LRPFSLAHSLVLRALGNPYVYVGAPATETDLFVAVDVCCRTRAENAAALSGGLNWRNLLRWRRKWRRLDFSTADASFRQYLSDSIRRNRRNEIERKADSPELAGPVEYHLHRHLCEDRGWPDEAAWDCSLGYAWCLLDISQEWRNPGTIQSEYDATLANYLAGESAARQSGDTAEADRIEAEMREFVRKHQRQ
jgi:hypothetical protein